MMMMMNLTFMTMMMMMMMNYKLMMMIMMMMNLPLMMISPQVNSVRINETRAESNTNSSNNKSNGEHSTDSRKDSRASNGDHSMDSSKICRKDSRTSKDLPAVPPREREPPPVPSMESLISRRASSSRNEIYSKLRWSYHNNIDDPAQGDITRGGTDLPTID